VAARVIEVGGNMMQIAIVIGFEFRLLDVHFVHLIFSASKGTSQSQRISVHHQNYAVSNIWPVGFGMF